MRTFSTVATTELAKTGGAMPVQILEVQYPGGSKYYADQVVETEDGSGNAIRAQVRVVDWGEFRLSVEPSQVGGFGEATIRMQDADGGLRAMIDARPGIQGVRVELSTIFRLHVGDPETEDAWTDWDDRVVRQRGNLTAPKFNAETRQWDFKFRGLEDHYDKDLGFRLDQNSFADVMCQASEGMIIPIAFGDPVFRVPAVLIERPGYGTLAQSFEVLDDSNQYVEYIHLNETVTGGRFDTDADAASPKTYWLGWPNHFERITGYFDDQINFPSRITGLTRHYIEAEGLSPGPSGQINLIDADDVTDPDESRAGNVIWFEISGEWVSTLVTMWEHTGGNIKVGYKGDLNVVTGTPWKLGRYPGYIPRWAGGTPIYEDDDWVYAANHIPSRAIHRVECQMLNTPPGGGEARPTWHTMLPANFTSQLNNKTYNTQLGREADADGITTITCVRAPASFGAMDNLVYVSQNGPEITAGVSASLAPDVIRVIAESDHVGNVLDADINTTALDAASTWLAANRNVKVAVAVTEQIKFAELIGEIAGNGTCAAFFDGGQLHAEPWPAFGDTIDDTLTVSNTAGEPVYTLHDLREISTRGVGTYRPYPTHDGITYVRESSVAIDDLGLREREFEFPYIQRPTSAALALEFWTEFFLERQAFVRIEQAFLDSLGIQLADTIRVNWIHAAETVLDRNGPVREVLHRFANVLQQTPDELSFEFDCRIWNYTITPVAPSDMECEPPAGDMPEIDPAYGYPTSQGQTPP